MHSKTAWQAGAALAISLMLGGCTTMGYADGGYADAGLYHGAYDGYSAYGDYGSCDPWDSWDRYYGCEAYHGYADIGYRGGWYGDYRYPGHGRHIYDRSGRRHLLDNHHLRYWLARRVQWHRDHVGRPHGDRGSGGYAGRPGYGGDRGHSSQDGGRDHAERQRRREGIEGALRQRFGGTGADSAAGRTNPVPPAPGVAEGRRGRGDGAAMRPSWRGRGQASPDSAASPVSQAVRVRPERPDPPARAASTSAAQAPSAPVQSAPARVNGAIRDQRGAATRERAMGRRQRPEN